MNLYEKLNKLDDSLVESKRVVKKTKLTENLSANEYKLVYHKNTACKDRRPETIDDVYDDWTTSVFRADSDLDAWKEAFERVTGNYYDDYVDIDADEEDFKHYFEDTDWGDGSPILIKLSSSDSDLYDTGYTLESWIDEFVEQDHDDLDEKLTENRWNPYFTPYGYRDAAKVLKGKAPEYYYHLKEIEMDTGDGIKLAKYALRKGLPVMVDKNSDPDYPEFAIKGEYHWDDYFYPYPTAHEENLVAWDGKLFVDAQLTEAELTNTEKLIQTFPDEFGHWSTRPVNKTPKQNKTMDDYARDPNTPIYDNKQVTTNSDMSAKDNLDKLLKTFPDLDIGLDEGYLKEAVKDTDYVIMFTSNDKHLFFIDPDKFTSDVEKATTYPGKFSAEDDIKYAIDAAHDNLTGVDDYVDDMFSAISVKEAKSISVNIDTESSIEITAKPGREYIIVIEGMNQFWDNQKQKWTDNLSKATRFMTLPAAKDAAKVCWHMIRTESDAKIKIVPAPEAETGSREDYIKVAEKYGFRGTQFYKYGPKIPTVMSLTIGDSTYDIIFHGKTVNASARIVGKDIDTTVFTVEDLETVLSSRFSKVTKVNDSDAQLKAVKQTIQSYASKNNVSHSDLKDMLKKMLTELE